MPINPENIQAATAFAKWLANTFYPIQKIQEDRRNYQDGYKPLKFVIRAFLLMAASIGGFSLIYWLPESKQETIAEKIHAETDGDVAIDWRYQLGVAFITMCLSAHLSMYLGKQLHKLITILRYKEQNGNSGAAPFSESEQAAIDRHMSSYRDLYPDIYSGDGLLQSIGLLEELYSAKAGDLSFWQGLCQTYGKEHPEIWKQIIEHTKVENSSALLTELERTDPRTSEEANKETRLKDFLITVTEWARLARLNRERNKTERIVGCFYPNPRKHSSTLSKPQWAEVKILLRELRTTGLYRTEPIKKIVDFVVEMLEKKRKEIEEHKKNIQRLDSYDAPPQPQTHNHNQTESSVNAGTDETHPEHKTTSTSLSAHCHMIRFCAQQLRAPTEEMTNEDAKAARATLKRTANDLQTISTLLPHPPTGDHTPPPEPSPTRMPDRRGIVARLPAAFQPGNTTRRREEESAHAQESAEHATIPEQPGQSIELMEAGILPAQSALQKTHTNI